MRRFSAHLDTLYSGLPPLDRFAAAARDGFRCVELWWPPVEQVSAVRSALRGHGLELASINTVAGPGPDDFGQLGNPDAVTWWRTDFGRTLAFARATGAQAINVLVGGRLAAASRTRQLETVLSNLTWALDQVGPGDPVLLLEPLNGADRRSPLLRGVADARYVLRLLGEPDRLRILFDAYHLFQEEDDLLHALHTAGGLIGHVQIADYPGRNEPGSGEIPVDALLTELDKVGYTGWIGLEYFPSGYEPALAWLERSR